MKIRIKNTIKKIVQELKKRFVEGIILFGSYAKGKETPLSDIDICVIDNPKFPEKERKKAYLYGNDKVHISLFSELPIYKIRSSEIWKSTICQKSLHAERNKREDGL